MKSSTLSVSHRPAARSGACENANSQTIRQIYIKDWILADAGDLYTQ